MTRSPGALRSLGSRVHPRAELGQHALGNVQRGARTADTGGLFAHHDQPLGQDRPSAGRGRKGWQ